jgi:putative flippase GtrA
MASVTETPVAAPLHPPRARAVTAVEIVVPVFNEERDLEESIGALHAYLTDRFTVTWAVTVVDNGSTDGTWPIAQRLAATLPGVRALHLEQQGRGRALRTAWSASSASVVAYMDVDLSTDLDALLPLVAPLLSGHSDVAIGTRLASGARVVRGPKRELISRGYNLILRTALRAGFSDAQCGFKAVRTDVARELLPLVEDQGWFFDTELLVLAEHNGLRIHEVPVDWVDDPVSRVDLLRTAADDLRGVWRMLRRFARGDGELTNPRDAPAVDPRLGAQLVKFASIGVVSTVVFAALFALLDGPLGPVGADVVALLVCAFANTAANRRLTFALRGRAGRVRHYAGGTALGVLPVALTLAALGGLAAVGATSLTVTLVVLTATNLLATTARFLLLRNWVFRPAPVDPTPALHTDEAA